MKDKYNILCLEDKSSDSYFKISIDSNHTSFSVKEQGLTVNIPANSSSQLLLKYLEEKNPIDTDPYWKSKAQKLENEVGDLNFKIEQLNEEIDSLQSSLKTASEYIKQLEIKLKNMENKTINLVDASRKLHEDLGSKLLHERVLADNLADFVNMIE